MPVVGSARQHPAHGLQALLWVRSLHKNYANLRAKEGNKSCLPALDSCKLHCGQR